MQVFTRTRLKISVRLVWQLGKPCFSYFSPNTDTLDGEMMSRTTTSLAAIAAIAAL